MCPFSVDFCPFLVEPLDINPVGKLVRSLTKKARTSDEQPLRLCDIAEIKKRFETQFFYEEFLSVPCGVLSGMIFENPSNSLMRFSFRADQFLDRNFAWLRNWFRHALISGTRRQTHFNPPILNQPYVSIFITLKLYGSSI